MHSKHFLSSNRPLLHKISGLFGRGLRTTVAADVVSSSGSGLMDRLSERDATQLPVDERSLPSPPPPPPTPTFPMDSTPSHAPPSPYVIEALLRVTDLRQQINVIADALERLLPTLVERKAASVDFVAAEIEAGNLSLKNVHHVVTRLQNALSSDLFAEDANSDSLMYRPPKDLRDDPIAYLHSFIPLDDDDTS
ncbi:hypothetical protein HGRIS_001446 [Hohenbuehelia grisea]|uniref:Uncharacterized protein n=1 Tax=Hohenbuehelia grisea TaxID=104357 RepID=A0ABR3JPC8_9AGAR